MVGAGGRGTPLPYVVDLSSCVNVGLRRASAAAGTANNNIIGAEMLRHSLSMTFFYFFRRSEPARNPTVEWYAVTIMPASIWGILRAAPSE